MSPFPGPELVGAVQRSFDPFADRYARTYQAAAERLLTDREQLPSNLRLPLEHHH